MALGFLAPLRWSEALREELHMWFKEDSSIVSPLKGPQTSGIRETAADIIKILDEKTQRLRGHFKNIGLRGISQGAAMGLWLLLNQDRSPELGGSVGASCWLPFASNMEKSLLNSNEKSRELCLGSWKCPSLMISGQENTEGLLQHRGRTQPFQSTPVFLGHGMARVHRSRAAGTLVQRS